MRTLTEQATAVANGEVSPVELTEIALKGAEAAQTTLNAFTVMLADRALERAKELEGADPTGPLHGVPILVKDLYDMAGVATTGCCAAYHHVATTDAHSVEALERAGAIIIAKTNQHELALGTNNQLSSFGPAWNPWGERRVTGGSSGGSAAAVAAGVVTLAMGSDTGGSIRIPASFCGITGLKPTHGAVSLRGLMPLAPSFDTAGPLAVSAADCALVFDVIRGFDPGDVWSREENARHEPLEVRGLRVGIDRNWFRLVASEVTNAIEQAAKELAELGVVVEEVAGPDPDGLRDLVGPVVLAEAHHYFQDIATDERVTEPTRGLLHFGGSLSASDYIASRDRALTLSREMRRSFDSGLDALLVPATPFVAPSADARTTRVDGGELSTDAIGTTRCTIPVNAAGLPGLAFPVGLSADGMPLGAQLIGAAWSDETLCAIGAAYQEVTHWHLQRPPAT